MSERNPEIRRSEPAMPLFEQAHARHSDPETSRAAARSVVNLGRTREEIIRILKHLGPQTDEQIIHTFRKWGMNAASDSGIRSRRSELCKYGLVESCGIGKTASGRHCHIWRVK